MYSWIIRGRFDNDAKTIILIIRVIAVSGSGLLTQTLSELVSRQEEYEQANKQNLAVLKDGLDLGTHVYITSKRDDLHER